MSEKKKLNLLGGVFPTLGMDPEFFFVKEGKVIGAEKVIPENGLIQQGSPSRGKIIIDGVQGELNLLTFGCREAGAQYISNVFYALNEHLKKNHPDVSIKIAQTMEVTKDELDSLSPKNKVFGCDQSFNAYNAVSMLEGIDPSKYLKRSCGGHIHMGIDSLYVKRIYGGFENLVKLMDIIVGNTSVLIDRDSGNRERRKFYGKAGEYRLPKHGLEYRVLSNFWLTSLPLMSLVFGLTKLSVYIATSANSEHNMKVFFNAVKEEDIRRAIDTNNYSLALKNFNKIKDLIIEGAENYAYSFGLNKQHMDAFLYFAETIRLNGLSDWFKKDPLHHWLTENYHHGMYYFLNDVVIPHMKNNPLPVKQIKVLLKKEVVKKARVVKVTKENMISKTVKKVRKVTMSIPVAVLFTVASSVLLAACA